MEVRGVDAWGHMGGAMRPRIPTNVIGNYREVCESDET